MLWFNLYPWFNFYFPLFLCMVMSDNEDKTKENKNGIKYKNEPQHLSLEKDSLIFLESLSRRLISKTTRGLKEEPADSPPPNPPPQPGKVTLHEEISLTTIQKLHVATISNNAD